MTQDKTMAGYCVHGNRIWGSTKRGIFLEQSKTHQLSKKDCVLWRQLTPYFCFYIYIYIYIYTHTHTHVTFTIVRKVIGGIYIYIYIYGPGSSVSIATDYGLEGPGSNPVGDEIFHPSRPALGPTQHTTKWVPCLSRG